MRICTRSTTTCDSPNNWWRPVHTFSRSRTWPVCCVPRPPQPLSQHCVHVLIYRFISTPMTPRAVSWLRISRPGTPVSTPSTVPALRWPAPPVSRRCRRSWPRPSTQRVTPGSISAPCATSNPTGPQSVRTMRHSSQDSPHPPAACTPTRSRAGSCPTCASRPRRSAWPIDSRTSSRPMPAPTGFWADWSR